MDAKQDMRNQPLHAAEKVTRRSFLQKSLVAASAASIVPSAIVGEPVPPATGIRPAPSSSFLDLQRMPDSIIIYSHFEKTLPAGSFVLERRGEQWGSGTIALQSHVDKDGLTFTLSAPSTPIAAVHVRWRTEVAPHLLVLGDAWERSYGDLGWRNLIPERHLPWYFATFDGTLCHAYGVKTDARALCFWQVDAQGVSLWLNTTNGGNGVELGSRELKMATVVSHQGNAEDAFSVVRSLCQKMCARPSRPIVPVYGANDWCYSYGESTAESILRDTEFIASLSPSGPVRPFSVIDGGWTSGTPAWPDMHKLASAIRQHDVRPGIWIRLVEAPADAARGHLMPNARFGERSARSRALAYDPTIPEAQEKIAANLQQLTAWGYEMIKHDFSTFDLLGQWGFEMGPQPTLPGWSFNDRSRTNAEILADLYMLVRKQAGDKVLIDGCNTVGHLGQGFFDLQRTGDDTSGHQWERTRRMGVNTLAFRLPQNGTFFIQDADLVGITDAVPWEMNRQWLDVLARSGSATIVSAGPPARGEEQRAALREAFRMAAAGGDGATPQDWMETGAPERWSTKTTQNAARQYRWSGKNGASPFLSP